MKKVLIAIAMTFSTLVASAYSDLPNPKLTPGAVASTSVGEVCTKDYPALHRKVSSQTKDGVYSRYGIDKDQCSKGCKIDHLVPLSIGGSNKVSNLWPHEYGSSWSVYEKTKLEVRLRKAVCNEGMPIQEAQQCIASNWHTCYGKFYGQHK